MGSIYIIDTSKYMYHPVCWGCKNTPIAPLQKSKTPLPNGAICWPWVVAHNAWGWNPDDWVILGLATGWSCDLYHTILVLTWLVGWSDRPDPINWLVKSSPCSYMSSFDRIPFVPVAKKHLTLVHHVSARR